MLFIFLTYVNGTDLVVLMLYVKMYAVFLPPYVLTSSLYRTLLITLVLITFYSGRMKYIHGNRKHVCINSELHTFNREVVLHDF